MFSDRLENLIEAALQDGVLTDQEKASIVKRAQAEGEDIDEVEIYIESLMQKRQQEIDQEKKEANAIQAKENQAFEKKRAEILRKCPKCGTLIPHLTSVCPECGFIINANEIDRKVTKLIALLRSCIDYLDYNIPGESFDLDGRSQSVKIKKSEYEEFPNCYLLDQDSASEKGYVTVDYSLSGILSEISLYDNNDSVRKVLNEFNNKSKSLLASIINNNLDVVEQRLNLPSELPRLCMIGHKLSQTKRIIDNFKIKFQNITNDNEVISFEDRLSLLQKKYDELIRTPEAMKAMEKYSSFSTPIHMRIIWAIVLLLIIFSGCIIIILFFESGREWVKDKFDIVING